MTRRLFLALFGLFVPALAAAQDSTMFRANLQHTGVYESNGVANLKGVKWKFHTNGRVISSPAVAAGTIYVGSTDSNLYAIDAASGAQKWKFETGSWITSSPAVASGTVYFLSYDSNFYAVDTNSGQLKWKFQTGGERRYSGKHLHHLEPSSESMPDPWDFYLSSAAVWNGAVYFGSSDGNVYALDVITGQLKWKFQTGDVVHSSPAIADGTLFIGSWDRNLYALDAVSGKETWRFQTADDPDIHNHIGIQSSPVVANGVVYFGCRDAKVYALEAVTGKPKWTFAEKNGSWVNNSPLVYEGKVYFGTSIPGFIHSLNIETGEDMAQIPTGSPVFSSMATAKGILYVGNFGGKLTAIDLKSQKPVWTFETDGAKQNAGRLTNADGSIKFDVLFTSPKLFYDDMVVAVDKILSMGSVLSSPVISGDTVYVGSTDGNLYALR